MSSLPTGWASDRLKDVAAINAVALSAGTDPEYEFDYLEISNVDYHGIVDPAIRGTVTAHRDDRIYLEGAYRGQVNGEIQAAYNERDRYEELSDLKYTDTGGIFDIMAVTVIQHHLSFAA